MFAIQFRRAPDLDGTERYCFLIYDVGYGKLVGREHCSSHDAISTREKIRDNYHVNDALIPSFELSERQFDALFNLDVSSPRY